MTNKDMHPPSSGIDEALWAAYRRDDKAAVMDYLFRRTLVGIGRSRSFPQLVIKSSSKKGRAARRAHGRSMLITGSARYIPLRSRLN
jgi:hypothetical protein